MDRLPVEVLDLIVSEAVVTAIDGWYGWTPLSPSLTHWVCASGGSSGFYRLLLRLSLVIRAWAAVAQRQLMKRVTFSISSLEESSSSSKTTDRLFAFAVFAMPRWAAQVEILHLRFPEGSSRVGAADQKLSAIVAGLPALTTVCLAMSTDVPACCPRTWAALLALTTVRSLSIYREEPFVTYPADLVDAYAPRLARLEVSHPWGLAEPLSTPLPPAVPRLRYLALESACLDLSTLPRLVALRSLRLDWSGKSREIRDRGAELIRHCAPTLESLSLTWAPLRSFQIAVLTRTALPSLRSLEISDDTDHLLPMSEFVELLADIDAPALLELSVTARKSLCALLAIRYADSQTSGQQFPHLRRLLLEDGIDDEADDGIQGEELCRAALKSLLARSGVQMSASL